MVEFIFVISKDLCNTFNNIREDHLLTQQIGKVQWISLVTSAHWLKTFSFDTIETFIVQYLLGKVITMFFMKCL